MTADAQAFDSSESRRHQSQHSSNTLGRQMLCRKPTCTPAVSTTVLHPFPLPVGWRCGKGATPGVGEQHPIATQRTASGFGDNEQLPRCVGCQHRDWSCEYIQPSMLQSAELLRTRGVSCACLMLMWYWMGDLTFRFLARVHSLGDESQTQCKLQRVLVHAIDRNWTGIGVGFLPERGAERDWGE